MPKVFSPIEVLTILQSGDLDQLVGGLEDEHLECKSAPYNLKQEHDKMEFAKDVSALANADGGIILIGVQTEEDLTVHGDIIRRIGCFGQGLVNCGQCHDVISEWVLPSIPGLKIQWHPSVGNTSEGIVSIHVPQEACEQKPFLVSRVVEDGGKINGSYVGFFERTRDNALPMKPPELRARLKDGLRFNKLDSRLESIEEIVGKIFTGSAPQPPPLSFEQVFGRVQRAREAVGYDGKPTFSLAAWPIQRVEFPSLFESHDAAVVQLLENPPRLRYGGFDISTGRRSAIMEAQFRRCLIPDHKLLEIWRDGPLICVVPGDDSHLCWGMRSTPDTGLRINNLALAETVYLFCDWALKVYEHAVPSPTALKFRIALSNMFTNGRPFSLSPFRPNTYNLGDDRRPAQRDEPLHVEETVDRSNADSGEIAYRLLSFVYAWFTFNASDMPYVNRETQPPRIDPAQFC
jgi:hypothetical protein